MTGGEQAERLESVPITRETVRRGDVLMVGGRQMEIRNVVRTITGARLDFPDGERMWLTARTELTGLRGAVPRPGGGL
ncbi:hypothetical protein FNQ90_15875 [Streptomyces alkaliphilus]|uniref:Uncharacterized protein n=1 Tax=Streptomyces alkaliphilus TaxID=1472722 RepID=A0A7W3TF65_9ACTN|nr:hypothetical protein [Streptomyces alkaliphilus]MBB0245540.1 hypothetical protein [Streptomyces alkaliphilus]